MTCGVHTYRIRLPLEVSSPAGCELERRQIWRILRESLNGARTHKIVDLSGVSDPDCAIKFISCHAPVRSFMQFRALTLRYRLCLRRLWKPQSRCWVSPQGRIGKNPQKRIYTPVRWIGQTVLPQGRCPTTISFRRACFCNPMLIYPDVVHAWQTVSGEDFNEFQAYSFRGNVAWVGAKSQWRYRVRPLSQSERVSLTR